MKGIMLIWGTAMVFRLAGTALMAGRPARAKKLGALLLCSLSAWLVVCGVGAWSPVYLALLPILPFWALTEELQIRMVVPILEVGVALATAVSSVPDFPYETMALTCAWIFIQGLFCGVVVEQASKPVFRAMRWLPVLWFAVLFIQCGDQFKSLGHFISHYPGRAWNLTVSPVLYGRHIELETGSWAWIDYPDSAKAQGRGVVIFHGADPNGAHQSAAVVLRRAFLNAGFTVLAVDHPGYGKSPQASAKAGWMAWDPFPTDAAAVKALTRSGLVNDVYIVGHSMGSTDVLRLLSSNVPVTGAWLFGASLAASQGDHRYWYNRFVMDRHIDKRASPLSYAKYDKIISAFYRADLLARQLPLQHPPVVCVNFEHDHPNVISTRNDLYAEIPGSKAIVDFPGTTHYFASLRMGEIFIGDASVPRRLSTFIAKEMSAPPTVSPPNQGQLVGRPGATKSNDERRKIQHA